jgi:hypothetical protein
MSNAIEDMVAKDSPRANIGDRKNIYLKYSMSMSTFLMMKSSLFDIVGLCDY